jgi:hypothetical protein
MLWIVDAKNSASPEARADWLRSELEDVKYLCTRFPKLKHTRLIMCPMYAWNGVDEKPMPVMRSVDLDNFTNPRDQKLEDLQKAEVLAESGGYEELNMSGLSTLLATSKIIYGLGGNPWTLKWAFQQPAGQFVLETINSENAIYIGRSAGQMVMSKWIGRLTGDSKFYNPDTHREAAASGKDARCIDVSSGDEGLEILPVNCCFRPHCHVAKDDGLASRRRQVDDFTEDHPQEDTIVIYTRNEDRTVDGVTRTSGGDAVAFYGGAFFWLDMDQPPSAFTSARADRRSCGCEEGCLIS